MLWLFAQLAVFASLLYVMMRKAANATGPETAAPEPASSENAV
jgi:hypothetical protein